MYVWGEVRGQAGVCVCTDEGVGGNGVWGGEKYECGHPFLSPNTHPTHANIYTDLILPYVCIIY